MNQLELERKSANAVRIARIIAFALMVSIFLYPAIVFSIIGANGGIGMATEAVPSGVVGCLLGVSVVCLLIAKKLGHLPVGAIVQSGATVDPGKAVSLWLSSVIIELAILDVAAILGVVLSLLTGSQNWCIFLGLASFIAIGRNWPKGERPLEFVAALRAK